jgi:hypothetical protein
MGKCVSKQQCISKQKQKHVLSEAKMKYLEEKTLFDKDEILRWHASFIVINYF